MKAEGYLLVFSKTGLFNTVFAPGCLKNIEDELKDIPIVNNLTNRDKIIGKANISETARGVYATCDFDEKQLDIPIDDVKSFGFYANKIHIDPVPCGHSKGNNTITDMHVRAISLEPTQKDTSSIKIYKEKDHDTSSTQRKENE